MKKNYLVLVIMTAAFVLAGCEKSEMPEGGFPKKHLIEEFTGMGCGYCPYGMNCISEFMANDTNWVLILHHYGYTQDKFTVAGCKTITKKLNVNGAPSACIDRTPVKTSDGTQLVFHPGYLPETSKAQFEKTTYASIHIENTYNEANGAVRVHVSGVVGKQEHPDLLLTVLIKESGMIAAQSDYYYSFEGWKEFRHANAVRAYLTECTGDTITIDKKGHYDAYYNLYLEDAWVPENCMVVAYLSEEFKPVIQAEQRPVVAGTKGGADIEHGGITPYPVADYYPEPSATASPSTYSGAEADTLLTANVYSGEENGVKYWQIRGLNAKKVVEVSKTASLALADIFLVTATGLDTIPYGTYPLVSTEQAGTAIAGFRNDEAQEIDGSTFYYISQSYYKQGYLSPTAQWLIVEGNVTISAEGWTVEGKTLNGSDIKLFSTAAFKYSQAPERKLKRRIQ